MKSDLYDITVDFVRQTDMAICINDGGEDDVWLPKSQIEYTLNHKGQVEITAPQWLLEDKGLV